MNAARIIGRLLMELLKARAIVGDLRRELAVVTRERDRAEASTWRLVETIERERRRADVAEQFGEIAEKAIAWDSTSDRVSRLYAAEEFSSAIERLVDSKRAIAHAEAAE